MVQADGRVTAASMAAAVNLSEAPCWRRLKRLQVAGYIDGVHARLNRKKLGYGVLAFVSVRFATHDVQMAEEFERRVRSLDQVISCHNVTGDVDYLLQIVAPNLETYGNFTMVLRNLPGVQSINSSLSLREVKSDGSLPI